MVLIVIAQVPRISAGVLAWPVKTASSAFVQPRRRNVHKRLFIFLFAAWLGAVYLVSSSMIFQKFIQLIKQHFRMDFVVEIQEL